MTRRQFISKSFGVGATVCCKVSANALSSLHCTPAPTFPVPLSKGTWRSAPFPVGKHDYHVWLKFDRNTPGGQLDCDLGPVSQSGVCTNSPLLKLEWMIWNTDVPVQSWPAKPIKAAAWSKDEIDCFLGDFEGIRNRMFTIELHVLQDPGYLKELHPRIEVVKNPGYWCWL